MEKRYQIFVSSTFADLKDERQIIMRTLMEMGHFPSGMEYFSAIDEEQWPFIEKVIDDSDYYVLILGGRYGSLADEEISYTEKEFDYAKNNNKKIIALVHGSPSSLPVSKTDGDNTLQEKLEAFREKVRTGRMVKFWTKPEELAGHVALALPKTIQMFPAVGWVRANKVASADILAQLNFFRTENEQLKSEIRNFGHGYNFENISGLDNLHKFQVTRVYSDKNGNRKNEKVEKAISWKEIFVGISKALNNGATFNTLAGELKRFLISLDQQADAYGIESDAMTQIIFQLEALNLIRKEATINPGGSAFGPRRETRYYHAELGRKIFLETKIIRKAD